MTGNSVVGNSIPRLGYPVVEVDDTPRRTPGERALCHRERQTFDGIEYMVINMPNPGYGDIAAEVLETRLHVAFYWPTADERWTIVRPDFDVDGSLFLVDLKDPSHRTVYHMIPA